MTSKYTFADLLKGASINQLSELFELDRRTVTDRLRDVEPCGKRATFPIYKILDAAPLLLERYVYNDKGELVRNEKRKQEPEKDFWDARLKEQKYLENQGDLWRTEKVVTVLAEILKLFRESMTVYLDQLEFETGLPADQVAKARSFGDNLLMSCHTRLLELKVDDLGESDSEADTADAEDGPDDDFSDLGL